MDEFMDTLRSCHTIPIMLNHMQVLDDNGDFQARQASRSVIECIQDFFKDEYGVLPHTFDNLEKDYVTLLKKLTEELGPLFIVIDEIGLTFNHGKLDDGARRKKFFQFCEMLQPLFVNRKLFFLIAGKASFLDLVTRNGGFNSRFVSEHLDLCPLGCDSIKTIIKKTRWKVTKSASIQDHLQLTEGQVTKAANHLVDTTFGHPRLLLGAFKKCDSYDDLLTYIIK